MRKSGLQMLLSSMGIEIDPAEVMAKYNQAKDIMPQLAAFVQTLDGRLKRIEEKLGIEEGAQNGSVGTSDARTGTGD